MVIAARQRTPVYGGDDRLGHRHRATFRVAGKVVPASGAVVVCAPLSRARREVQVAGELIPNALLVANHVSWLDIPVLGSRARIDFLSKADIKAWPLIGWMAETLGTLFVARGAN